MRIKIKVIAMTLSVILLSASVLTACGGAPAEEPAVEEPAAQEPTPEEPSEEPAPEEPAVEDPAPAKEAETTEQNGIRETVAVIPAAVSENMNAQEFLMSDEHWEWWDAYRDMANVSAGYKDGMMPYYRNITEKMLISDDANTVCSPLNMYIAFAMLAEVSEGNTRQQILDMLGVSDIDTLRTQTSALLKSNFVDTPLLKSLLANSLWLRDSIGYNEETLQRLAQLYCASSFEGDPKSPEMTEALQKWTDNNTGGLLGDYTKEMKLDPETVLAIVSTIYYKASWDNKFNKEGNTKETFHGTAGDTEVDMMHMTDMTGVYHTDKFTSVGLRLSESGSMFFYLPEEGADVNDLAADPDVFKATEYNDDPNLSFPEVHLSVPKFKVSGETDLLKIIEELGITDALDPKTADFTPITEDIDEIYISSAEHAAMVEVDENGVTGAAYTELAMAEGTALPEDEIEFVIDRPFMFIITGADGSILFSGIVRNIMV